MHASLIWMYLVLCLLPCDPSNTLLVFQEIADISHHQQPTDLGYFAWSELSTIHQYLWDRTASNASI